MNPKNKDPRRYFTTAQRYEIFDRQAGRCAHCKEQLQLRSTDFNHVKPWGVGGRTVTENGIALCTNCHRKKTHREILRKIE